ncbi:DMT family transporter [uncultured Roseobacter sp.]|uniref:DMT family transporter n=1 Tax=uncultured Roseobacter sp. TaxID=114847 RepID=UPI00345CAB79
MTDGQANAGVWSSNVTGAMLMMASMACFTINDALIKATGGAVPLFQLLVLRGVLATLLIAFLAGSRGAFCVKASRRDWALIILRSLSEVGAAYFFVTALLNMPLANITAILQVLPLTVTLGSALIFREAIGWRRMTAILIGFCGMLLIVRPGPEGFTQWSLYALIAVLCVTARDLSTRRISPEVPSLLVTFSASLTVLIAAGLASLSIEWTPITPGLGGLIAASSFFIVGGYFFSVQVMRAGDVSFIAPFRYTGLIWALLLGWVVFGEWPGLMTLLGAGIIVATGLFTLYRERALMRG